MATSQWDRWAVACTDRVRERVRFRRVHGEGARSNALLWAGSGTPLAIDDEVDLSGWEQDSDYPEVPSRALLAALLGRDTRARGAVRG